MEDIQEIQEKAMDQQKRINKVNKKEKNKLRRQERRAFKAIANDRAVINLRGVKQVPTATVAPKGGEIGDEIDQLLADPNDVELKMDGNVEDTKSKLLVQQDSIAEEPIEEESKAQFNSQQQQIFKK